MYFETTYLQSSGQGQMLTNYRHFNITRTLKQVIFSVIFVPHSPIKIYLRKFEIYCEIFAFSFGFSNYIAKFSKLITVIIRYYRARRRFALKLDEPFRMRSLALQQAQTQRLFLLQATHRHILIGVYQVTSLWHHLELTEKCCYCQVVIRSFVDVCPQSTFAEFGFHMPNLQEISQG